MAIDLPPVIPPELSTQESESTLEVRELPQIRELVNGIPVRVVGNRYLPEQSVRELLLAADKPSRALAELTRRFYDEGHLLVKLNYRRQANEVIIEVEQLRLKDIKGDRHIVSHFDNLKGDADLKADEFHSASALARSSASRTGISYSLSYQDLDDEEGVTLVFSGKQDSYRQRTEITSEASNKGSRYLGRYFAGVGVRHITDTGTAFGINYNRAVPEAGESRDGKNLEQISFSVSKPSTFGLYGLELSSLTYEREPVRYLTLADSCESGAPICTVASRYTLNADIERAAVSGEQILYSRPGQSVSVTEKLEHVDSRLQREHGQSEMLREVYQVAELGLKYSASNVGDPLASPYALSANLRLRGGMGDGGTLDQYTNFYQAFSARYPDRPVPEVVSAARTADFLALKAGLNYQRRLAQGYVFSFSGRAQLSDKQLPQQQQFVLGGMYSMSAYLGGALVGDEGLYAKTQIETGLRLGSWIARPAIFAEYGASRFNQASGEYGQTQSLVDAGLKLKLAYGRNLESEIALVRPVHENVVNETRLEAMRVNFYWRLQYRFL